MGQHTLEGRKCYRKKQKKRKRVLKKELRKPTPFKRYFCNVGFGNDSASNSTQQSDLTDAYTSDVVTLPSNANSLPNNETVTVQEETDQNTSLSNCAQSTTNDKPATDNDSIKESDSRAKSTFSADDCTSSNSLSHLFSTHSRATTTTSIRLFVKERFEKSKQPINRKDLHRLCQSDSLYVQMKEYSLIKSRYEHIVENNNEMHNGQ
jgi:hypothetical protein